MTILTTLPDVASRAGQLAGLEQANLIRLAGAEPERECLRRAHDPVQTMDAPALEWMVLVALGRRRYNRPQPL